MPELTDFQAQQLMRNLRILAGAETMLTALEGGSDVPDLLLLVQRRALETADLATAIAVHLQREQRAMDSLAREHG